MSTANKGGTMSYKELDRWTGEGDIEWRIVDYGSGPTMEWLDDDGEWSADVPLDDIPASVLRVVELRQLIHRHDIASQLEALVHGD